VGSDSDEESWDGEGLKSRGSGSAAIGADIAALGGYEKRKDVLNRGLDPVVRRLQKPASMGGFASYEAYEGEMNRLSHKVNMAVAQQFEAGTERGMRRANELLKVGRELAAVLNKTAFVKGTKFVKREWDSTRRFILSENNWTGGGEGPDAKNFAEQCKKMNMFSKLYGSGTKVGSEPEDPEDKLFGDRNRGTGRERKRGTDVSSMKCHTCGKIGHGSWQCKQKRDVSTIRCFRCQETGHMAKDCENEKKNG
jgi:hypothetical protein